MKPSRAKIAGALAAVAAGNAGNTVAVAPIATNSPVFTERDSDQPGLAPFFWVASPMVRGTPPRFRGSCNSRMKETKEQHIEVEGVVSSVLAGTMFRVELENKHMVLATICGKMRKRWVRITAGDRVKMEMSPYDLNKARITWRLR